MDYVISAAGLALIGAPWAFGFSSNSTATWTSIVLGLIVCAVAAYRALTHDTHKWEEWVVGAGGLLAIGLPFIFGFATPALWSTVILGVVVAALASYQLFYEEPRGRPAH